LGSSNMSVGGPRGSGELFCPSAQPSLPQLSQFVIRSFHRFAPALRLFLFRDYQFNAATRHVDFLVPISTSTAALTVCN
jgi:hypothetical protein